MDGRGRVLSLFGGVAENVASRDRVNAPSAPSIRRRRSKACGLRDGDASTTRQTHVCRSLVLDQCDCGVGIPSSNRLNHRIAVGFMAPHKEPDLALANTIHQRDRVSWLRLVQSSKRLLGIPRPAFVVRRCDDLE